MDSSTEIVKYLHQISMQQQKFAEKLDMFITVLSGPSERLPEVVDQTPVTLSMDQNPTPSLDMMPGNPSVDSQSPVPSENPDLSRFQPEEIFSLRQKAVSAKNFAVLLMCYFFQPRELVGRDVREAGKPALNPSRIDTIKEIINNSRRARNGIAQLPHSSRHFHILQKIRACTVVFSF